MPELGLSLAHDPATLRRRSGPIQLWIDPICPWCLIAVTRMTRAADSIGVDADIRLHGFRLHPDWPEEGMSWRDFQVHRSLPDPIFDHVAAVGRADGLPFDFGRIARVPDTTRLHLLLIAAERAGIAMPVYRSIADAYFFGGANLADPDAMTAAALAGGMTAATAQAALASPALMEQLIADERAARRLGVRGVPFMLSDGVALAGAQTVAAYAALIARTRATSP